MCNGFKQFCAEIGFLLKSTEWKIGLTGLNTVWLAHKDFIRTIWMVNILIQVILSNLSHFCIAFSNSFWGLCDLVYTTLQLAGLLHHRTHSIGNTFEWIWLIRKVFTRIQENIKNCATTMMLLYVWWCCRDICQCHK